MNEPIRVLHIIYGMNTGGRETMIMNYYRNIDRSKVQFDFLIGFQGKCDYEDEIIALGGIMYRIPKITKYFSYLKELNRFYKNNKYDIIHCHTDNNFFISSITLAKKYDVKKIIYHSTSTKFPITFFSKFPFGAICILFHYLNKSRIKKYATHYFTCSPEAGDHLFGKYIDRSQIKVINNAVDTEKFIYNADIRAEKRRELNIENKFVVGHVGRFDTVKNHGFLIDIFKEIHSKNSDAVLLLVGDGKLRRDIEDKVNSLGLKDSVILTGVRPDIPDLLCAMDVFLFPSLYEGLPVTLVEAQANGLHCIISDTITDEVGITSLIEYIPLSKTSAYWAEKVLEYLDGYERHNMEFELKEAEFDIKEVAKRLQEFYLGV